MAGGVTNISAAKASLSRSIERIERGERIVIGRAGLPVAMLFPYQDEDTPPSLTGRWRQRVWMADHFDTLPDELAEAFGVADRDD